ncbi:MAG TPA: arginine--tRNA ligase [Candidatus Paceibacterota bacterium]
MRKTIQDALESAVKKLDRDVVNIPLEYPTLLAHGDYASGIALQLSKQLELPTHECAKRIVSAIGSIEGVAEIHVAGPGFINFLLAPDSLNADVEMASTTDMWGASGMFAGKKIMVEYTDPNPFKEFHIGHLVPNALGEALSRFFQFSGAEVRRANWQGDVGVHVAKSLYVLIRKDITDPTIADLTAAYPEGSRLYEEDNEAKREIDALNKAIYEKSDGTVNALYEKGRKLSLESFERIYKILGTKFDYYFFESDGGPIGVRIVREHPEIFPQSDGAVVFRGEEHGLHTRVFINSAGLPTYEAKEIGLAVMKKDAWDFDLTLTITGNEQAEYFRVVMKAMELALPDLKGKLAFQTNGMLRFAEGKMSSRLGNIVRGEDLIADLAQAAQRRASESRALDASELAQQVAVGAIKYQILKQASGKDIIFDRERALSLEGDSGPYLQYAHARAHQIVEKAGASNVQARVDMAAEPNDVVRLLHRFPGVVERAASEREPHILTNYLTAFAAAFNSWYAQEQILDGSTGSPHKVAIVDAVRRTLKNGLWILAIPSPEKM